MADFRHPRLVLRVLELANRGPRVSEVDGLYRSTMSDAIRVGLVARESFVVFGRFDAERFVLTSKGEDRLRLAHDAAWKTAAGLSVDIDV